MSSWPLSSWRQGRVQAEVRGSWTRRAPVPHLYTGAMPTVGATQGPEQVAVAWWLRGATAQTLWARLARSRHLVRFEREVLTTDDDDDLVLDHARGAGRLAAPAVAARSRGERPFAPHAGAGGAGGAGRLALHRAQLSLLRARSPADLAAAAEPARPPLSLGGDRRPRLRACAGWPRASQTFPSTRLDSRWAGTCCSNGWARRAPPARSGAPPRSRSPTIWRPPRATWNGPAARFYTYHFLRRLKPKALDVLARFPGETAHLDAARIGAARTVLRVRRGG